MKLYVGNATQYVYDFTFKMFEQHSIRSQKIQPGTQACISGDLTSSEIDHIVAQHAVYGLLAESRIDPVRTFTGICYSVGKPITAVQLPVGALA